MTTLYVLPDGDLVSHPLVRRWRVGSADDWTLRNRTEAEGTPVATGGVFPRGIMALHDLLSHERGQLCMYAIPVPAFSGGHMVIPPTWERQTMGWYATSPGGLVIRRGDRIDVVPFPPCPNGQVWHDHEDYLHPDAVYSVSLTGREGKTPPVPVPEDDEED